MTTITSQDGRDHDERVHSIGAVLTASLILSGLLLGGAIVASQIVDLVAWAFAGR